MTDAAVIDLDATTPEAEDRVIWRPDLCTMLGVGSQCVREWIKKGKLPQPDIDLSTRTKGWRMSTLHAAGIKLI